MGICHSLEGSEDINDFGTITFSGDPNAGDYIIVNSQGDEHTGTYSVSKTSVTLAGDIDIHASLSRIDRMLGAGGDDLTTIKWTATRLAEE